jgi:hypothetical protein
MFQQLFTGLKFKDVSKQAKVGQSKKMRVGQIQAKI